MVCGPKCTNRRLSSCSLRQAGRCWQNGKFGWAARCAAHLQRQPTPGRATAVAGRRCWGAARGEAAAVQWRWKGSRLLRCSACFRRDGTAGQHPSGSASADAGGWERAAVQRLMKMVLLGSVHPRVGRGWEIVDNQLALPLTTTCRVMVNGGASAGVLRWFAMCKERASARVGAVTNWEQSFRARPACVGACLIWSPIGGRGAFRRAAVPGRRSSVDG